MYVWLEFFTRHKPDSTMAKPACMNITRKPHTRVHVKLIPILFWPTWLATSPRVRPVLESETGTSLMVPVRLPPGSPFTKASLMGAFPAASLSSAAVDGGAGGGGVVAAGAAV